LASRARAPALGLLLSDRDLRAGSQAPARLLQPADPARRPAPGTRGPEVAPRARRAGSASRALRALVRGGRAGAAGGLGAGGSGGRVDRDAAIAGLGDALRSLARHVGSTSVHVARTTPPRYRSALSRAVG